MTIPDIAWQLWRAAIKRQRARMRRQNLPLGAREWMNGWMAILTEQRVQEIREYKAAKARKRAAKNIRRKLPQR